jgi:broad specificity phosphatase PhoE
VTTLALPESLAGTLVLVRHGESTYVAEGRFQGRQDAPLSELGRRQAAMVAGRLAQRDEGTPLPIPLGPPLGVWHSPLSRAADTAREIAAAQPSPINLRPLGQLTEIAQGEWEGLPATDVRARWPAELAAWRRAPTSNNAPGGEPVLDAAARVREGLALVIGALAQAGSPDEEVQTGARSAGAHSAGAHSAGAHSIPDRLVPGYPRPPRLTDAADPWAVMVAHDGIFRLALMSLLEVPYERFWSFPFNLCAVTVVALSGGIASLRAHNLSEHLAPLAEEERAAAEARGDRRGAL